MVTGYFGQDVEIPMVVVVLDAAPAEVEEYMHDFSEDLRKYVAEGYVSPSPLECLSWLRGRFEVLEFPLVVWDCYNGPMLHTQIWRGRDL